MIMDGNEEKSVEEIHGVLLEKHRERNFP